MQPQCHFAPRNISDLDSTGCRYFFMPVFFLPMNYLPLI
jgi:hypothetical protein